MDCSASRGHQPGSPSLPLANYFVTLAVSQQNPGMTIHTHNIQGKWHKKETAGQVLIADARDSK